MRINVKSYIENQWYILTATSKGRILITIGSLAVIISVWFYSIMLPLKAKINGYAIRLEQAQQEHQDLLNQSKDSDCLMQQVDADRVQWQHYRSLLANTAQLSAVKVLLENVHAAGLHLDSYAINQARTKDWYVSERVSVKITGSSESLIKFFEQLKKELLIASCSHFTLTCHDAASKPQWHCQAELHFMQPKEEKGVQVLPSNT